MIKSKMLSLSSPRAKSWSQSELELIRSATALIDEGGNWSWSLRDFAEAARAPQNAIFRKFRSREKFVSNLATAWSIDIDHKTFGLEGVEKLVEHRRWLVYHRERAIFLVAESAKSLGYVAFSDEYLQLLPNFDLSSLHVWKAHQGDLDKNTDLVLNITEAVKAGIGLLMFQPPSIDCDDHENEMIFQRVFTQVWQLSTGLEACSAPVFDLKSNSEDL